MIDGLAERAAELNGTFEARRDGSLDDDQARRAAVRRTALIAKRTPKRNRTADPRLRRGTPLKAAALAVELPAPQNGEFRKSGIAPLIPACGGAHP